MLFATGFLQDQMVSSLQKEPISQIPLRPFQKCTYGVTKHSTRVIPLMLRKEDPWVKEDLKFLKWRNLNGMA